MRFCSIIIMLGILLVSCSLTNRLSQVASYSQDHQIEKLVVRGDQAYLAGGREGTLIILDVSDPIQPTILATLQLSGYVVALTIQGNLAYVALRDSGLSIVDISNPLNPVELSHYKINAKTFITDIVVVGDYAYLANYSNGLRIVNISDPKNPVEQGRFMFEVKAFLPDLPPNIVWVEGVGDYLYISGNAIVAKAYDLPTIMVLDITNPVSPRMVQDFDQTLTVSDMVIRDNIAYVVDSENLFALDVSSPANPQLLGKTRVRDLPGAIVLKGNYAYIAALFSLRVIDISNPANMVEVASFDSTQIRDVAIVDDLIYVVDTGEVPYQQIRIFKFDEP